MNKKQKVNKLISLIESYTNKKVVFENDGSSVSMTTNQFEKNEDKVKKIVDKGYDINLTDLKEDEHQEDATYDRWNDAELENFRNSPEGAEFFDDEEEFEDVDFDYDESLENFEKTLKKDTIDNEFIYDEEDDDDFLFESEYKKVGSPSGKETKSRIIDFSGELCSLIKKIKIQKAGDMKAVKAEIESAWQKVKQSNK